MKRDAAFALTAKDVQAVKKATLGTNGVKQKDGTW